ncbi:unnamed protein product [Rangifer tarandus platyrhynchus]|uniref:Uncharacterized protein n=2 Tax=Rangifer tarandus platyrhynchus TaxID=3082113 RepID=A0AC59ZUP9_RANTA|nr:unnamed protein product [Rangifer tarandus platyrhynchus]
MKVKSESEVAQSCPTISDPMDCSLPGSSAHGIFQARVLEWGAIAFSKLSAKDGTKKEKALLPSCSLRDSDTLNMSCNGGMYSRKGGRPTQQVILQSQFTEVHLSDDQREWEKAMATHSSTLAWKIPWTEEPFAATLTVINWKSEARCPKTTTVAWKNADVDS